ncbi:hypothetical protein GCM10023115_25430 [Pontixanthobacter gangjinensis]|uniref:Class I SAM-dependent methyltransferase n=1 Tax=Christiangramia aestuarii TaxID=1028746 RepID=A0A7K1LM12_9FLAO|nr:hypothetical protein [Christiangramia aestuarii]MUP41778.1 hypothetical protein [Christiangramia aestuarii]
MSNTEFTKQQYQKFSQAEGSQYIVSEYALNQILKLVQKFKPVNILELGVGIGTISDSILKRYNSKYQPNVYGIENNSFCLSKIPENLGEDYRKLKLFNSIQGLPENIKFDFLIIDGKDNDLELLKDKIRDKAIIVVEGDRKDQTDIFKSLFPSSKFVHSITSKRNSVYSNRPKDHFQGGIKLLFRDPDLKQNFKWLKLKFSSKINFQLRRVSR